MPDAKRIAKPRTSSEIAADLDRTRGRIDLTLDALQRRLKPSNLARDAVRRVTSTSVRRISKLADGVADSKAVIGAKRLAASGAASMRNLSVQESDSPATRRRKRAVQGMGAAAVAAVLTAAAAKAVHSAYGQQAVSNSARKPSPPKHRTAKRKSSKNRG